MKSRKLIRASGFPQHSAKALPVVAVVVKGWRVRALLDPGCSKSVLVPRLSSKCLGESMQCDRMAVECTALARLSFLLRYSGNGAIWISCTIAERLLARVEAILGMDVVARLGGVMGGAVRVAFFKDASTETRVRRPAWSPGVVTRRRAEAAATAITALPMTITDQDFTARFDGAAWVVKWTWKDGHLSCWGTVV